jgi:hypothetical protein
MNHGEEGHTAGEGFSHRGSHMSKKRQAISITNNKKISIDEIATNMINSVDVDGDDKVSAKDIEFLVGEYLNSLNKKKLNDPY